MLERCIAAVRDDITRIGDMGEARRVGLEDAREGLLEAGADEGAVASAAADEAGRFLGSPTQQEVLAQFRQSLEAGTVIEGLGGVMRSWRSQALCSCLYCTPCVRETR